MMWGRQLVIGRFLAGLQWGAASDSEPLCGVNDSFIKHVSMYDCTAAGHSPNACTLL